MTDRPYLDHRLTFTLPRCRNWADAETRAARVIRRYTNEHARGRGAVPDGKVLRDATFAAVTGGQRITFDVTVEVDV